MISIKFAYIKLIIIVYTLDILIIPYSNLLSDLLERGRIGSNIGGGG